MRVISTSGRESSRRRYEALLTEVGLKDVVSYHTFDVSGEQDASRFARELRSGDCIGGAISKGIKASIISELDILDESAEQVQSVNTVVVQKESGKLVGYNTDYLGFHHAISDAMVTGKEKGKSIGSAVIYGYGGVTLVCCHVLRKLGVPSNKIYITGRSATKAKVRAEELEVSIWDSSVTSVDLFVNASPVTDYNLADAEGFLAPLQATKCAVFDHEMPGQKLRDWFRDVGTERGLQYISGTAMYIPQCISQWSLFLATRGVVGEEVASVLSRLFTCEDQEQDQEQGQGQG